MTRWLEVSLTVDGEMAEAVADVFARFAPNGVVTEQAVDFTNEEDEGTPKGDITVRAYLLVDEHLDETRHKLDESLYFLSRIRSLPVPVYKYIPDQNWMEAWKARYQPVSIGKKLIIVPAWLDSPEPSRIPIKIDPGMAFGTGTHPTTQLSLELLETLFGSNTGIKTPQSVIDIGCGSGILSIAALKLGTKFVLGVDIDQAAIENSRENANNNQIKDKDFSLAVGSVNEIRSGKFEISSAPLVLANILAPVIIRLFEAGMADLVDPGGHVILSGILDHQVDDVIKVGEHNALRLVDRRQVDDWVALLMGK